MHVITPPVVIPPAAFLQQSVSPDTVYNIITPPTPCQRKVTSPCTRALRSRIITREHVVYPSPPRITPPVGKCWAPKIHHREVIYSAAYGIYNHLLYVFWPLHVKSGFCLWYSMERALILFPVLNHVLLVRTPSSTRQILQLHDDRETWCIGPTCQTWLLEPDQGMLVHGFWGGPFSEGRDVQP